MQLTKDEIEEVFQSVANDDPEVHLRFAAAVIAAHTAKVLGDVEPVAWGIFAMNGNIRFWSCDKASADAQAAKTGGEVVGIYPAHTVAALAARVAELEKDALRYRLIRSEMAVESGLSVQRGKSRRKIVVKALMAWWPGVGPVASGSDEDIDAAIDAALAAKGQA